jgi:hypothetical protein
MLTFTRGVLFLLLAIISFLWKTVGQTVANVPSAMPTQLALLLRGIIMASIILDVVGLFCIWRLLQRIRNACLDRMKLDDEQHVAGRTSSDPA